MAETILSPGVLARENDSSAVQEQPITVGAAVIGPTAKGPVEIPKVVTTYSQFKAIFGGAIESGSDSYNYMTDRCRGTINRLWGCSTTPPDPTEVYVPRHETPHQPT